MSQHFFRLQHQSRQRKFALFMKLLQPTARDLVLDCGGGDSSYFEALYPWPERIVVLDIALANLRQPGASTPVCGNGLRLPFANHCKEYQANYLAHYAGAAIAYNNEVDGIGDMVEQVILEAIIAKDVETAKWYAKNKLKHRGYVERHEFQYIKDMTDAELVAFIQGETGTESSSETHSGSAETSEPTLH